MQQFDLDPAFIGAIAAQVAQRIQAMFATDELWVPIDRYCRLHGLAIKTVRRAIESGRITEHNGGLAPGCGTIGARKRIHRFFDPHLEKVVWPH